MSAGFIKPFHSSTNPEILLQIRSAVPEIDLLRGRPIRKYEKIDKKHWQNIQPAW